MAFVHLSEPEKAKVFPVRCRRIVRRLVMPHQTVVPGQSPPWPLSTWANWKKPRFSSSLPPHRAAVG